MHRKWSIALAAIALAMWLASSASAQVITAVPKPEYTKPGGLTFKFNINSSTGAVPVCRTFTDNLAPVIAPHTVWSPFLVNDCWSQSAGSVPYVPTAPVIAGHRYTACLERFDPADTRRETVCSATTIDATKPIATVKLAGGKEYSNSANVPVEISYNDTTSPPWTANWTCVGSGFTCTPGTTPDANCASGMIAETIATFTCTKTLSGPDGRYTVCAKSADSAVPDGTTSPTPASANVSDVSCDSIVLDTTFPTLTIFKSEATVVTGKPVTFTMAASEAPMADDTTWYAKDSLPTTAPSLTRTFSEPGEAEVTVTRGDAAGNMGAVTLKFTVEAPAQPTPEPTVAPTVTPTPTPTPGFDFPPVPTPTPTPTPAAPVVDPPAPSIAPAPAPVKPATLLIGKPKLKAGRRSFTLTLTTAAKGPYKITLTRNGKTVASATGKFKRAGTSTVRITARSPLTAGTYKLKVTFNGTTKNLIVKVSSI